MLSLLIITTLLTICANSCSPPMPIEGKYYISNGQLLSDIAYPDSILLTIRKTAGFQHMPALPVTHTNYGPWCKIMNVKTGSVGDVVSCSDYTHQIRNYATPDPRTTTVSCQDNCDGSTATCIINRNGIPYTFNNIRYLASSAVASCNSPGTAPKPMGNIFISFTITNNGITTTYISFATNMVGIEWDDTMSPIGYIMYNVDREGDWSALTPGDYFAEINSAPSVYSDVNIIQIALPCCLCHSQRLIRYSITTNRVDMSQVFTLQDLGFGGGQIDAVKSRVLNRGLFHSDAITVYDLAHEGVANTVRPNLCDFIARCFMSPCQDTRASIHCPSYPFARCVPDYCGGCNARWFCGSSDVTDYCNSGFISTRMCPAVN